MSAKRLSPTSRLKINLNNRAPLTDKNILFEDEYLIAWNKPAGLLTHATLDPLRDNLLVAANRFLKARAVARGENPDLVYLGLHHRLDRETSGVIIMTRSKLGNLDIQRQFQEGSLQKSYVALASGTPPSASYFSIRNHVKKRSNSRPEMIVVNSGGDFAHTDFKILDRNELAVLVEAQPKTGRTHQIRVHLATAGVPIINDKIYSGATDPDLAHFFLHAQKLKLRHPLTGSDLTIEAPIPKPFQNAIRKYGLSVFAR